MCVKPIGRKAVIKSYNLSKPIKQYKAIYNDFGLIECIFRAFYKIKIRL